SILCMSSARLWAAITKKTSVLRLQATQDLRPSSLPAVFRQSKASPAPTGFGLYHARPRPRQEAGCPVDGRHRRLRASARGGALTVDGVVEDMIRGCRAHKLRAVGSERKLLTDFTVLLTAKTMHALFGPSRRKWIAL